MCLKLLSWNIVFELSDLEYQVFELTDLECELHEGSK